MSFLPFLLSAVLAVVPVPVRAPEPGAVPGRSVAASAAAPEVRAVAVLHAWDRRRAAAWARGDPAALRRLYAPGSSAGRADVAMLRAWRARGLRVGGLRMQVLSVRVHAVTASRMALRVTDRVASAYARAGGARIPLPRDAPTTRRLVLRRVAGEWRMVSATPAR